ncbi:NrsF family protein [Ensifer sp. LC163]|uniref:NrsF family protein n=1 Tax=Ensifer sp. LC163 TaxID=1120652 RepID=UPI000813A21F|nr:MULTISPECIES: DUF1109 domain-containing protein [unclassified Ensifer]OCP19054.1 hypothetical protein BC363_06780 [Ensifer sp. LC384]OCP28091.1 hypothetical protein BC361_00260 [Ensifer sp. LC54]OCP36358.1 hypothetical protein BC360_24700 [Ensifer sp. LC163]
MKTNDLISLLAEDAPVGMRLGRMLAIALLVGVVVSALVLLSTVGVRPNLAAAIETARVLFKIGFTLVLAAAACRLVFIVGRPGLSLKARGLQLAVPLVFLAIAVASELSVLPSEAWTASMLGRNAAFCLFFIPVLSLAPLAGFLLVLKNGAPESPGLAGASAGLAAGAIAASLYAFHCPDDSPLFLAVWYSIAVLLVTTIGYLIGRRWLRW